MFRRKISVALLGVVATALYCNGGMLEAQRHAAAPSVLSLRVKTDAGLLEGQKASPGSTILSFKGIPYAAPPIGDLRWKEPQPITPWEGVRPAVSFGSRCMQAPIYPDMVFRDQAPSEDCLTLNVWTPSIKPGIKLPVMVWIHGGGFQAGASSEPRQEGENLARKGVVLVSVNYRLGFFGFLALPELSAQSEYSANGNYGLLDQVAALKWVKQNISAFGGDADNVTIFGESAGSFSVSYLMASPLAKGLFQKAIGESGSGLGGKTLNALSLKEQEAKGAEALTKLIGTTDPKDLRAKSAQELLSLLAKEPSLAYSFIPCIDGYFLPQLPSAIYRAGKQAHIPLLAGWNRDEGGGIAAFAKRNITAASFKETAAKDFEEKAEQFLTYYPAKTDAEAIASAKDLAGDRFIALATWKWLEAHATSGESPVYRYRFDQAPPPDKYHPEGSGAYHSSEIEYVFGNFASKPAAWTALDRQVSEQMMNYWTNFAKTGDPNGKGLPAWPVYAPESGWKLLYIGGKTEANKDDLRERYEFLRRYN